MLNLNRSHGGMLKTYAFNEITLNWVDDAPNPIVLNTDVYVYATNFIHDFQNNFRNMFPLLLVAFSLQILYG